MEERFCFPVYEEKEIYEVRKGVDDKRMRLTIEEAKLVAGIIRTKFPELKEDLGSVVKVEDISLEFGLDLSLGSPIVRTNPFVVVENNIALLCQVGFLVGIGQQRSQTMVSFMTANKEYSTKGTLGSQEVQMFYSLGEEVWQKWKEKTGLFYSRVLKNEGGVLDHVHRIRATCTGSYDRQIQAHLERTKDKPDSSMAVLFDENPSLFEHAQKLVFPFIELPEGTKYGSVEEYRKIPAPFKWITVQLGDKGLPVLYGKNHSSERTLFSGFMFCEPEKERTLYQESSTVKSTNALLKMINLYV